MKVVCDFFDCTYAPANRCGVIAPDGRRLGRTLEFCDVHLAVWRDVLIPTYDDGRPAIWVEPVEVAS